MGEEPKPTDFIEVSVRDALQRWLTDFVKEEICEHNGYIYLTNQIVKVYLRD